MFTRLNDDTIIDQLGRVIFPGPELMRGLLLSDKRCILCCKDNVKLNAEHVIPNWLLRICNLHHEKMTLLSENSHKFATYKIKICHNCNEIMGSVMEDPISVVFKNGFSSLKQMLLQKPDLLYAWVNWLFFKTHYKDRSVRLYPDKRKGNKKIGKLYSWERFQAILCFARAPIYGNVITPKALGSLFIFKVTDHENFHPFNYADNLHANILLIRVFDCAVIAVLVDGKAVEILLKDLIRSVGQEVTAFQLSEIFAEIQFSCNRLRCDARLEHEFDRDTGEVILEMGVGTKAIFDASNKLARDNLVRYNLSFQFGYLQLPTEEADEIFRKIRQENFSFIPALNGLVRNYSRTEITLP